MPEPEWMQRKLEELAKKGAKPATLSPSTKRGKGKRDTSGRFTPK